MFLSVWWLGFSSVTVPMVGGHALRMDGGNGSGVVVDDSPASSPSSSPSPDGRRRELQRARVLQAGGLGGRGRPAAANAARERSRVQTLRNAFLELQRTLPSVPPDTKLSKLDVLILATTYIAHLTRTLQEEGSEEGESSKPTELHPLKGEGYLHPVKVSEQHQQQQQQHVGRGPQHTNSSHHIFTEMANAVQTLRGSDRTVPERHKSVGSREPGSFVVHLPVTDQGRQCKLIYDRWMLNVGVLNRVVMLAHPLWPAAPYLPQLGCL